MNYEDELNYDNRKVKSSWTNVQLCSFILDWEEGVNYPEKEIFGLTKADGEGKGGNLFDKRKNAGQTATNKVRLGCSTLL